MWALIVCEGLARGALAGVRGLHADGWHVGVASQEDGLAGCSRYATRFHRVPPLADGTAGFVAGVGAAVRSGRYDVVFPAGDAEMRVLSAARDELGAVVALPAHASVERALDKIELGAAGARAGFGVPRTVEARAGEAERIAPPLIVKPRTHYRPEAAATRLPSGVVRDPGSVDAQVTALEAEGGVALLQEHVAGRLMAWVGVVDRHGRLLGAVQQEASRTHPPGAGVTARGTTTVLSHDVTATALRLLDDLGWWGLAQLQFIVPVDGRPRLIDFNGRFYGSMALALGAGVNVPALWASAALEPACPPADEAAVGTRFQWLAGDLRNAWATHGAARIRDTARTLRWAVGAQHSVWRRDDPRPALRYVRVSARRLAGEAPLLARARRLGGRAP